MAQAESPQGSCTADAEPACVPAPQDLLHEPHAAHGATAQCSGHGSREHGVSSSSAGHALPPFTIAVSTTRRRWRVALPHVVEQVPQPNHELTTQSTGQACELQLDWHPSKHSRAAANRVALHASMHS